jgi:ectoine hydroxylase-related dioxygenase (phytanoyl-CoA dioxygenase family)
MTGQPRVQGWEEQLDERGYVVLAEVAALGQVAAMRAAIPGLIEQAKATDGAWRSRSTLHLGGLVEHAAFDPCWRSPVVLAAMRHLLGSDIVARPPHLRGPAPGYGAQQLHRVEGPPRDDTHHHATVIVPLVHFTAENGATRVLPGSHRKWLDAREIPAQSGIPHPDEVTVIAPAGSAIVFSEHLFHSSGVNRGRERRDAVLTTFFRAGYDHHHSRPMELSDEALDRLGDDALLLLG